MNNLLARILLLVVGVLIGIDGFIGIKFLLHDDNTTIAPEPTEVARVKEIRSTTKETGGIDTVPSRVEHLVFPDRTFERKAAIVSWVATLTADEVVNWLEQSTEPSWQVSQVNRTELQTTLLQKLSTTAPDRAIDFALAREEQRQVYSMSNTVFQVWANTDIDGAVARVKELNEQAKNYHLGTLLRARDDFPLTRMREIAIVLGDESVAFAVHFQNLAKGDIESPRDTWHEIVNLANIESVQSATGFALSNVAAAWVEDSGLDVLDEIVSSISSISEYSNVLPRILRGVATSHPEEVFDYVMSNLGDQATEIIQNSNIGYFWAQKDPQGMLAKAEALPASRFRGTFIRNAVWRWAESNPRQLLEKIEIIPPGEREFASSRAIETLTASSPSEAAKLVMKVPDVEFRKQLAESFIRVWANTDLEAAKEWVLSLPAADQMRASLVDSLTRTIVHTDPRGAFELARQQPIEEEEFSGRVISRVPEESILHIIAWQDIDLALELFAQVRIEGRASAAFTLGSTLIRQGDTEQALGLVGQIPEDEQPNYYQMIAMSWPEQDRTGLLNAFNDFPTTVKSKIAMMMIMTNEETKSFSEEQITSLQSHISEDDKELLDRLKKIDMNNPTSNDMEVLQELYSM
ncbi:MAG: hypothetical protein F4X56_05465 [Gammaproteobacteria bacterium]|nr:hypothetical protein [Gammaproteobacteria bacterium]MYC25350.1 hypothetical protein [Gammaproteobacteria bacterium]